MPRIRPPVRSAVISPGQAGRPGWPVTRSTGPGVGRRAPRAPFDEFDLARRPVRTCEHQSSMSSSRSQAVGYLDRRESSSVAHEADGSGRPAGETRRRLPSCCRLHESVLGEIPNREYRCPESLRDNCPCFRPCTVAPSEGYRPRPELCSLRLVSAALETADNRGTSRR